MDGEGDELSINMKHGDELFPRPFVPRHEHVSFSLRFYREVVNDAEQPTDAATSRPRRHDLCGNWSLVTQKGKRLKLRIEPHNLRMSSALGVCNATYQCTTENDSEGSLFLDIHKNRALYTRLPFELSEDEEVVTLKLVPSLRRWLLELLPEDERDVASLAFRRAE